MKARIHKNTPNGLYWGQIYNEQQKRWENVTCGCITELGAKMSLKKWRRVHSLKVFEI